MRIQSVFKMYFRYSVLCGMIYLTLKLMFMGYRGFFLLSAICTCLFFLFGNLEE